MPLADSEQTPDIKWQGQEQYERVSANLTACSCLNKFIIQEDWSFDMECWYSTIEEEMDAPCITPYRNAPFSMSFFIVVPNKEFEVFLGISGKRELWST